MGVESPTLIRKFVGALLPGEYRAQVLGDLEERYQADPSAFGYLSDSDATSAIPAVWTTLVRREWLGPAPNLARAGDDAIRQRTDELRGKRSDFARLFFILAIFTGQFLRMIAPRLHPWAGLAASISAAFLLFLFFRWSRPAGPAPTLFGHSGPFAPARDEYRKELTRLISSRSTAVIHGLWFLCAAAYWFRVQLRSHGEIPYAAMSGVLIAGFALGQFRNTRLRRELRTLDACNRQPPR